MKKKLLLLLLLPAFSFAQPVSRIHPSQVSVMEFGGVSKKLSDHPVFTGEENKEGPENPSLHKTIDWYGGHALPGGVDGALQKNYMLSTSDIKVLSVWDGLSESGGIIPSDNTMVVGPAHVLQMVNSPATSIRIWDKASGELLVNEQSVSSITGASNLGDPNIIYDAGADRYIFVVLAGNILSSTNITICVSKTNDPTGEWYIYKINCGGLFSSSFPDFPKLGIWGNAYYITTNSAGPYTWVADRNAMLQGLPAAKAQKFTMSDFPGGGIQAASPVTVTGNADAPADSKAIIIRPFDDAWTASSDNDVLELYKMDINWDDPKLSSMTGPFKIDIAPYDSYICNNDLNAGSCVPQQGTANRIDAQGAILNDKPQYRNFGTYESFVCTHITDARGDGISGIRWYELRRQPGGEWYIYQQGTYSPDDEGYRFISSVSINGNGDIAAGYNVSGKTLFPGFRITGRRAADDAGQMTAAETIIENGDAAQGGSDRYGDYNSLVNDPSDNSFWFTSNYTTTGGQWATSVVHFEVLESALPVSFVNFTAQKNIHNLITLNWSTANEHNNDYFSVERSANGISFSEIGRVPGTNNTQAQQYVYIDKQPAAGNNFYRLRQVDKDGKFIYSKQVLINMDAASVVKLYPNPAAQTLFIEGLPEEKNTSITVYDMQGAVVFKKEITGINKYALPVSSLQSGNYIIKLSNDVFVVSKSFTKQ